MYTPSVLASNLLAEASASWKSGKRFSVALKEEVGSADALIGNARKPTTNA